MLGWLVFGILLIVFLQCNFFLIKIFLRRPLSYMDKVFILLMDISVILFATYYVYQWLMS